jgi:hypothetical protein
MTANNPKQGEEKKKYEPNALESNALRNFNFRRASQIAPRLKVQTVGKKTEVSVDHPDGAVGLAVLMEALGTTDYDFVDGLLRQLTNAELDGDKADEANINFLLAVVRDAKPKDHLEAMLLAQMAVVHVTSMEFARRLRRAETLQEQDSAERAVNKLYRTFAVQMETRKRYRVESEPQVTVNNVAVNEGGQAIVGNVTQTASASPVPALPDARMIPMPLLNDEKDATVLPQDRQKDVA